MGAFIAFLALVGGLQKIGGHPSLIRCEYWIYPLQTLVCGALLLWFWRLYLLGRPARPGFGAVIGLAVFLIWIAPQTLFGIGPRTAGFDPDLFSNQPALYWPTVVLRFVRLVVVVPLVEEIFWRGFLLRYLINEEFDQVPIGKFSWFSFVAVTIAFAAAHSPADWPAALITGAAYNGVVYRTKSLSTCVIAHALTNLLLGLWIMHTKQWGFW